MHSLVKACVLATLCFTAIGVQGAEPDARFLTPAAVQAAVEELRHDPNLSHDKKIRTLHWVAGQEPPRSQDAPSWMVGLFQFLAQSGSLVIWVAGAIGFAIAAVGVFRLLKTRRSAPRVAAAPGAARVQGLDINPNSLPAEVGVAALSLLEAGRAREALSLLYRGSLSRAVHRFAVPVGDSFTEGEALRAVGQRLDQSRVRYFAAVVGLWQHVVYAGEVPAPESVATLCREFAPIFDAA